MERYTAADNGAPPHPNDVTRRRFPRIYQPIQQDEEYLVPDLITRWSLPRFFFGSCLLHFLIPTFQHSLSSFFFQKSCLPEFGLFYFIILIFFFITKTQNVISWVFLITFYRKQTVLADSGFLFE